MAIGNYSYEKLDRPEVLRVLFHPRRTNSVAPPTGAIDFDIPVTDGVTVGARLHPASSLESPTILFFHGNGEIVDDYDEVGPCYNEVGLSLLAVDYRGYGRSNGSPTVTSMLEDSHVIFREARNWLAARQRTGVLVVMGRSLGSAPALEVAANHQGDIAGLIIESGFSQTMPLLHHLGLDAVATGLDEADGFRNVEKIEVCTKPTLILHARFDEIIPVASAEILQAQSGARTKEFLVVPRANHNTVMAQAGKLYFEVIKRFVNKLGNSPARGSRRYRR